MPNEIAAQHALIIAQPVLGQKILLTYKEIANIQPATGLVHVS
jgi:hypothetical protein